jgi:membrane associated rhomboid family serine protease
MIPLKDYNPTRSFPFLTIALIAVNVGVFIQDRLTGHYERIVLKTDHGAVATTAFVGGLSKYFALVPATLFSDFPLMATTVLTSMFLHGNWLHIGSNMLYLWIFGDNIEDYLGKVRFLIFYFACGVAAAVAQILSDPLSTTPMVGASGAIAGILGAYLLLFPGARVLTLIPIFIIFTTVELPAFFIIGYWALIQFLNASLLQGGEMLRGGGVAYFAHIGGFVAGAILILLFGGRPDRARKRYY